MNTLCPPDRIRLALWADGVFDDEVLATVLVDLGLPLLYPPWRTDLATNMLRQRPESTFFAHVSTSEIVWFLDPIL